MSFQTRFNDRNSVQFEPVPHSFAVRAAAAITAGLTALGPMIIAIPRQPVEMPVAVATSSLPGACAAPSDEARARVDAALFTPVIVSVGTQDLKDRSEGENGSSTVARLKIAKTVGANLLSAHGIRKKLYNLAAGTSPKNMPKALKIANEYAVDYGLSIEVAPNIDASSSESASYLRKLGGDSEQNNWAVISTLADLTTVVENVSTDFFPEHTALRKVVITPIENPVVLGFARLKNDDIAVDPFKGYSKIRTIRHEFVHKIDQRPCNKWEDMYVDPAWRSLNFKNFVYADDLPKSITPEYAQQATGKSFDAVYTSSKAQQLRNLISTQAGVLKQSYVSDLKMQYRQLFREVAFVSEYSKKNVVEDKAEVGAAIMDSYVLGQLLSLPMPKLHGKIRESLSRLDPKTAAIFIKEANATVRVEYEGEHYDFSMGGWFNHYRDESTAICRPAQMIS